MKRGDVWGAILADVLAGRRAMEIVERDDGYVMAFDAEHLVAPFARWDDPLEKRAMRFVRAAFSTSAAARGGSASTSRNAASRSSASTRRRALSSAAGSGAPATRVCSRSTRSTGRSARMPGQLRVRVRYRELATRWIDWLQVSPEELQKLVEDTGWRIAQTLGEGPSYVAILDRT